MSGRRWLTIAVWVWQVTDKSLQSIADGCPGLTTLAVASLGNVTDIGFAALAAGCPRLLAINMTKCTEVTDKTLHALSEHCADLAFLSAISCRRITDQGLASLVQCRGLRWAGFSGCVEISDAGVASLGAACHRLEQLFLGCCGSVTDLGPIAQGCPALKALNLHLCNGITYDSMRQIKDCCSELEWIRLPRNIDPEVQRMFCNIEAVVGSVFPGCFPADIYNMADSFLFPG